MPLSHNYCGKKTKRLSKRRRFGLRLRQALHHLDIQFLKYSQHLLIYFNYKQTPHLYTCIDVKDVLTVEDTINALRFEAVVKQFRNSWKNTSFVQTCGFCCLLNKFVLNGKSIDIKYFRSSKSQNSIPCEHQLTLLQAKLC